jgi:hypothetical protein
MRKAYFVLGALLIVSLLVVLNSLRTTGPSRDHRAVAPTSVSPNSDHPNVPPQDKGLADDNQQIKLGDIASVPLRELADILTKEKPTDIAALARELDSGKGDQNTAKVTALFKAWATIDPLFAAQTAVAMHNSSLKNAALSATVENVVPASAGAVADVILHAADGAAFPRGLLLTKSLIKWSQANPVAAAAMLTSPEAESAWSSASDGRPAVVVMTETFGTIGRNFAATDPAAALQWAQNIQDPDRAEFALHGTVQAWWQTDPSAAESYVLSHAGEPSGSQMGMTIARSLAAEDPDRARQWVDQIQNPQARMRAQCGMVIGLAPTNPAAAVNMAASLPSSEDQQAALFIAMREWLKIDSGAAQTWVEQSSLSDDDKQQLLGSTKKR